MDILEKLNNHIDDIKDSINEGPELRKAIDALDKTVNSLQRNKEISADILIAMRKLEKRIQAILNKPLQGPAMREGLNEKKYDLGKDGNVDIKGDKVTITLKGKSVTITKEQLSVILSLM